MAIIPVPREPQTCPWMNWFSGTGCSPHRAYLQVPQVYLWGSIKFPHIIRKISASLHFLSPKHLFFLIILILILSNISYQLLFPASEEKQLRLQLMQNPRSRDLHEKLGQYYLPINLSEAQREYKLAQENYNENLTEEEGVLGIQLAPQESWENIQNQKQRLLAEIEYWQSLLQQFPDYQYSLLKLATIYTQLGNKDKAREYLNDYLKLSPTEETALKLEENLR